MSNPILEALAYRRSLNVRDLTDAALGPHAIQLLVQCAIEALRTAWQCPVVIYRAPPVVTIAENYDDLLYPTDGASRDARYTRYVSGDSLLRTQTSAMIPRALPLIAAASYSDVLIACPGLTYRRDSIDRLHVGEPHQLDLWRVRKDRLQRDDLIAMAEAAAVGYGASSQECSAPNRDSRSGAHADFRRSERIARQYLRSNTRRNRQVLGFQG